MFKNSIPVICYHRIDKSDPITPDLFESHLRYLKKSGIKSVGLKEMQDHLSGENKISGRCLMLTFDDGYQDFYHNAYPLLKKYEIKAVVFLIADRLVSDSDRKMSVPALSYDEIHTRSFAGNMQGFLSLEQVLEMQESGLVEFGAHTKTHAVVRISSLITDIYRDQKLKWYYRDAQIQQNGNPLFELAPNLVGPEFIPNPEYIEQFTQLAALGGESIPEIESKLTTLTKGVFESRENWFNRITGEIAGAKQILESKTGKPITAFCWPWGIESEEAKELLKDTGYKLLFTLERGSNSNSEDAFNIKRFSARKKGSGWLYSRILVFNSSLLSIFYDRRKRRRINTLPSF